MSDPTVAEVLKNQERQKGRIREELVSRASQLSHSMAVLARRLEEIDDAHINSLGECQREPDIIDRLCALYMEKRDLIHWLRERRVAPSGSKEDTR